MALSLGWICVSFQVLEAQQCGAARTLDLGNKLRDAELSCNERLIYRVAAVADDRSHQLDDLLNSSSPPSHCPELIRTTVITILAKRGDAKALNKLEFPIDPTHLGIVGDDRAIRALMEYLASHELDNARVRDQGDYRVDPLTSVVDAMFDISQRRRISDLPPPWPGNFHNWEEYLQVWKAWWDHHRGQPITTAPYQTISDPTLRCLARTVDWGFPDDLLEIADRFGHDALNVLESFPPHTGFAPMGTIPGNLQAALAKVGEQRSFELITDELQQGDSSSDALHKLRFVGDARVVDALVRILGTPTRALERAKRQKDECVNNFNGPQWKDNKQKAFNISRCEAMYKTAEEDYESLQSSLLGMLSSMVENPPLPPGALATSENFQKWKRWWERNRGTATVLTPAKDHSYTPP